MNAEEMSKVVCSMCSVDIVAVSAVLCREHWASQNLRTANNGAKR